MEPKLSDNERWLIRLIHTVGIAIVVVFAYTCWPRSSGIHPMPPSPPIFQDAGAYDSASIDAASPIRNGYCIDPQALVHVSSGEGLEVEYISEDWIYGVSVHQRHCRRGEHFPCYFCGESSQHRIDGIGGEHERLCPLFIGQIEDAAELPFAERVDALTRFAMGQGSDYVRQVYMQTSCYSAGAYNLQVLYGPAPDGSRTSGAWVGTSDPITAFTP